MSFRKVLPLVSLVALTALGTAESSSAAVTLGSTPANTNDVSACAGSTLFVQKTTATSSPKYTAPTDGVITSWSVMGRPMNTVALTMKVVRLTGPDIYTVVATEPETPIVQAQLNTFPTRIPVKAGDQPAIWITPLTGSACYRTAGAAAGDTIAFWGGSHPEPAVGGSYPTPSALGGNTLLDLSAQLEPDVDGDGFGGRDPGQLPAAPVGSGAVPSAGDDDHEVAGEAQGEGQEACQGDV